MQPRILTAVGLALTLLSCGASPDIEQDASNLRCEFGAAQSLGTVLNSPVFDGSPTLSSDETEILFTSARNPSASRAQQDIFVSTRPLKSAPWSLPVNVGSMINDSVDDDFSLRLSGDGLSLYYASNRSGAFGSSDMYVATRASRQAPWNLGENLGPLLNTEKFEAFPTPSPDGLALYFNRSTTFDSADSDLWVSSRTSVDDQWSAPQPVAGEVNSASAEFSPALSGDGTTLYFASERSGRVEIWAARRLDGRLEWGSPEKLGPEVNVPQSMTLAPFVSSDQQSLYFMSARQDPATPGACTPQACFDRLDLYVSTMSCS